MFLSSEVLKMAWEVFARDEIAEVISGQSQNFSYFVQFYVF